MLVLAVVLNLCIVMIINCTLRCVSNGVITQDPKIEMQGLPNCEGHEEDPKPWVPYGITKGDSWIINIKF